MKKISRKALNVSIALMMILVGFAVIPGITGSASTAGSESLQDLNRPLLVQTNKPLYKPGEDISIFISNIGKTRVNFETMPKYEIYDENGNKVYPTTAIRNNPYPADKFGWRLDSGDSETNICDQVTLSSAELSAGRYEIRTISDLPEFMEGRAFFYVRDMGYVIIVAGNNNDDMQTRVDEACNQIFDDCLSMGYTSSRIYYLNGWSNWRVDNTASSATVEDAIKVWAEARVGPSQPLFLVMFDHGGNNNFCVDDPPTNDNVFASDLDDWLDYLEAETDAPIYTWYMACHSGSFIDDLTGEGRITITSSRNGENSGTAPAPYHEKSASQYWPEVKSGSSLGAAFNVGSHYVAEVLGSYHPLLDDNGDGVGHGWDTPDPSGYLPHDGDGGLAQHVYMGGTPPPMPHIPDLIETRPFIFPRPPELIPIIVEVESIYPLAKVIASVIPPVHENAFQVNENLIDIPYQNFEMSDPDGDGTWTVDIPIEAFSKYFKDTTDFQVMVTVEDENGQTAVPVITGVVFTRDGTLPPDTTPPGLRILSPKYLSNVEGTVTISAVAMDDTCVAKAEIILDDIVVGTINLPDSANYGFDYELDTSDLSDGFHDVMIQITDKSGNTYSQSTVLTMVNGAVRITPDTYKEYSQYLLESVKTGNKKIDGKLDFIITRISKSLDSKYWDDAFHLDAKFGHKVFTHEKTAVMKLLELMNHNLPDTVRDACMEALLNLLIADLVLANTARVEASAMAGTSKKADHEIAMAEDKFDKSFDELLDNDYGQVVDLYRQTWEHSQKALG